MRTRTPLPALAALAALLSIGLAAEASAQGVVRRDSGGLYCDNDSAPACDPGPCPSNTTPVTFGSSGPCRCLSEQDLPCITGGACPSGTTGRTVAGLQICVNGANFAICGPGLAAQCFTDLNDDPVRWRSGDCDRDGYTNGSEDAVNSDPCLRPPPLAFDDGNGCGDLVECLGDSDCAATGEDCINIGDHRYCDPDVDEGVFCCGGLLGRECPNQGFCEAGAGGDPDGLCEDSGWCGGSDYITRRDCFFYEGERVDNPESGDCDSDEIPNSEEASPSAACVFDDVNVDAGPMIDAGPMADAGPLEDAGPGEVDAGPVAGDAGPGSDGGPFDAGPGTPSFNGGGGCRCEVRGAPSRPALTSVGLLLAAGLSLRRRRRR